MTLSELKNKLIWIDLEYESIITSRNNIIKQKENLFESTYLQLLEENSDAIIKNRDLKIVNLKAQIELLTK